LLNVADKPILNHIVQQLETLPELDEITIVTNDRFYRHFTAWKEKYNGTKKITIVNDGTTSNEDRLGAVGDLHHVLHHNTHNDILVIGGDNLFQFNLHQFHHFYKQKQTSVLAVHDLKEKEKVAKKLGVAVLNEDHQVIDFQEKPEQPKSTLAATLCYILTKDDCQKIEHFLHNSGTFDNPGDLIHWLSMQQPGVHGFIFTEQWFDIGSFEGLEEANRFYKEKMMMKQS